MQEVSPRLRLPFSADCTAMFRTGVTTIQASSTSTNAWAVPSSVVRRPPSGRPSVAPTTIVPSSSRYPAALLERPSISGDAEVVHGTKKLITDYEVLSASAAPFDAPGFHEYTAATHRMDDLEKLSAELLQNLQQLNLAAEGLESMAAHAPSSHVGKPYLLPDASLEERRAKRAAARAARRTVGVSALTGAAPITLGLIATKPPAVVASASTAAAPGASLHQRKVQEDRQRLEGLLAVEPAQSATSSASVSLSQRVSASHTPSTALGPSLPTTTRSAVLSVGGPTLPPAGTSSFGMVASRRASMRAAAADTQLAASASAGRVRASGGGSRRTVSAASVHATAMAADLAQKAKASTPSSDGTTNFMKKAATLDLLSGGGEKDLATIVKDLLFLERVKSELSVILRRQPSVNEWSRTVGMDPKTFAARVAAGQAAKAMMVQANYRLVISVCKKYQNRGIVLQDLITEGVQGLLRGVEKFDPEKGFRFSTYAHWWIRQAVTRSLSDQARTVRLPAHIYELLMKIKTATSELTEQGGREPSTAAISERTGLSGERIREIMQMARPSGSLDTPVGEDDGMESMKDMLEDERSTPDEVLDEVMLRRDLASILCQLSDREAGVIRLRFGLDGESEMTLEDIGVHFSVTRERIRQIEAKAVRKLKQKQREVVGILHEYSSGASSVEMTGRKSQGTNKQG
ncbi:hypothetical protein FOA52_006875 [Chlamydomonas sp. UWO 241]|nr:hypothetical protein FOA52_006875 [Chlamydomonas sp. UWO 241]